MSVLEIQCQKVVVSEVASQAKRRKAAAAENTSKDRNVGEDHGWTDE
jgi:hypothetical protein